MTCVGGVFQCLGALYPQLEKCDGSPDTTDWDCDGNPTNGFDFTNDVRNCGGCGNSCLDDHTPTEHVAAVYCQASTCKISQCADDTEQRRGYGNGASTCDTSQRPAGGLQRRRRRLRRRHRPAGRADPPQVCVAMTCRDVCDISGTPCAGTISACVAAAGSNRPG
jgi:hypothetical protein